MEDAVGGEERGKEERHPQHAGRDAGEQIEVGPEAERRDGDHHEVEAERRADGAAFAKGECDIALKQGESRSHATRSFPSVSLRANLVLRAAWLATTAMPPVARWFLRAVSSSLTEAASSEVCGSSSNQIGAGRGEKARQREPPFLSRREETGGEIGQRGQPEGGKSGFEIGAVLAKEFGPEGKILIDTEPRLHRIGVADIVAKLRERGIGTGALQAEIAGGQRKEPRDLPQQARLAGAVRPGDKQRFAGRKVKT